MFTCAVTPAIASKQYGSEDILARLVVAEAALSVMPENNKTFNVDNVRVVKIMKCNWAGSKVVQGMVLGEEPKVRDTSASHLHQPPRPLHFRQAM